MAKILKSTHKGTVVEFSYEEWKFLLEMLDVSKTIQEYKRDKETTPRIKALIESITPSPAPSQNQMQVCPGCGQHVLTLEIAGGKRRFVAHPPTGPACTHSKSQVEPNGG